MAALGDIYIKLDKLKEIVKVLDSKGQTAINLTLSISDQTNEHGQNVTLFVKQSDNDKKENKKKYYVANGNIFWHDGKIQSAVKPKLETTKTITEEILEGDLPF